MKPLLNTLYVTTQGAWLRLEGETLIVTVEKEKRLQVPLHHLGSIVCFGLIHITTALMARCMEDGRSIVWLDENGRFLARVESPTQGNILLRQAQYRAADDPDQAQELARLFVAGKVRNSRQVLLRSARDSHDPKEAQALKLAAQKLANSLRQLENAETVDTIRGIEGDAARIYFAHFSTMIAPAARESFQFDKRTRRPPRDPVNALISFLYALILNDCRSALETAGLDSQLGFLHAIRPGRPALALDLLEEFRAVFADRLALTLINRGQITLKDFDFKPGNTVLLNDKGRKKVIKAYQERKKVEREHTALEQRIETGLIPLIQARFLARYLRKDMQSYLPYIHK